MWHWSKSREEQPESYLEHMPVKTEWYNCSGDRKKLGETFKSLNIYKCFEEGNALFPKSTGNILKLQEGERGVRLDLRKKNSDDNFGMNHCPCSGNVTEHWLEGCELSFVIRVQEHVRS